jgi:hypothetical protein
LKLPPKRLRAQVCRCAFCNFKTSKIKTSRFHRLQSYTTDSAGFFRFLSASQPLHHP